jgi:LysM repeat protein
MQQIERYGVIALILMLVTIVAVSLWDDSTKPEPENVAAATELQGVRRDVPPNNARSERPSTPRANRQDGGNLPLSARPPGQLRANLREDRPANPRTTPRQNNPTQPAQFEVPNVDPHALQQLAANMPTTSAPPTGTGIQLEKRRNGRNSGRARDNAQRKQKQPRKTEPQPREQRQPLIRTQSEINVLKDGRTSPATYKVKSGDTLGHISLAVYKTSKRWKDIAAANPGMNPDVLIVGRTIKLPPAKASKSAPAPRREKPRAVPQGRTYTVRPGDILSRIAQREVGSVHDIKKITALNPGINVDILRVGDVIALPERRSVPIEVAGGQRVAQADKPRRRATSNSSDRYRVR